MANEYLPYESSHRMSQDGPTRKLCHRVPKERHGIRWEFEKLQAGTLGGFDRFHFEAQIEFREAQHGRVVLSKCQGKLINHSLQDLSDIDTQQESSKMEIRSQYWNHVTWREEMPYSIGGYGAFDEFKRTTFSRSKDHSHQHYRGSQSSKHQTPQSHSTLTSLKSHLLNHLYTPCPQNHLPKWPKQHPSPPSSSAFSPP